VIENADVYDASLTTPGEAAIGPRPQPRTEAIPLNSASTAIPEFVAYHIIGGTLVDLRHADRMLGDLERQASDPVRAANLRAIRAAIEQLRHVTGPSLETTAVA
jgi:hypothetical protein